MSNVIELEKRCMKKYQGKSDGFVHRKIAGTNVLIAVGKNIANYNGYIEMNAAAAFLWDELKTEKTMEELEEALVKNFQVDATTARADIVDFLNCLQKNGMVNILE